VTLSGCVETALSAESEPAAIRIGLLKSVEILSRKGETRNMKDTALAVLAQLLALDFHKAPRSFVDDDDGLRWWVKWRTDDEDDPTLGDELSLDQVQALRGLMAAEIAKYPKVVVYVRDGVVDCCISSDERLRVFVVDEDVATSIQEQNAARKGADDAQFPVYPHPEKSRQERRAALEAQHGQVWDVRQFFADFEFIAFEYPRFRVRRRADGVEGSLGTKVSPRFFFGFQPAPDAPLIVSK